MGGCADGPPARLGRDVMRTIAWRLSLAAGLALSLLVPGMASGAFGPPIPDDGGDGTACVANCSTAQASDGGAIDILDSVDDIAENDPSRSDDDVLILQTRMSRTSLRPGDEITWLFDSDADPRTGDSSGFERRVRLIGAQPGQAPGFVLERVTGPSSFVLVDDVPLALRTDNVLLRIKTSDLGMSRGRPFGFVVRATYTPQDARAGGPPTFADRAPETGNYRREIIPPPTVGPAVTLGTATPDVDRVVVTGTVDSQSPLRSVYGVEYGTTPALGMSRLPAATVGPGPVAARVEVPGLSPGTLYFYRLVATNTFDAVPRVAASAISTFTTLARQPPGIGAVSGVAVSRSGARLLGSVNPNGSPTQYRFEFGPTARYGRATSTRSAGGGTAPAAVSEEIASLQPGRTYHFRLVATSPAGESRSEGRTFRSRGDPRLSARIRASARCSGRDASRRCRVGRLRVLLSVRAPVGLPRVASASLAGARVRLGCLRGCRRPASVVVAKSRSVDLTALVRGLRVRPGAVLEIRVTRRGTVGLARRLTVSGAGRGVVRVKTCRLTARPGGACRRI